MSSWRVPERGRGESKVRYRDRLNRQIADYRTYTVGDTFPSWDRDKFKRRIAALEKAVRALLAPEAR